MFVDYDDLKHYLHFPMNDVSKKLDIAYWQIQIQLNTITIGVALYTAK